MVNSLHGQGIDRPAPDLFIEAVAPDGQIEAVSLPGARFVVGVQWHPGIPGRWKTRCRGRCSAPLRMPAMQPERKLRQIAAQLKA